MLTPADAEKLILEAIPLLHREDCGVADAHGRLLRADLRADRDLPPFDRVTMDGFALNSAALARGARTFRVEATQAAGMRPFTLGGPGDGCIEVMTGAVLPVGTDCVVPYEDAVRVGDTAVISDGAEIPGPGRH